MINLSEQSPIQLSNLLDLKELLLLVKVLKSWPDVNATCFETQPLPMVKLTKTNGAKNLQNPEMREQQFCLEPNMQSKFLCVVDHDEHVNDSCPWSPVYQI